MAILPIITGEDHPILRAGTKKVETVTTEVKTLLADMRETLVVAKGVGLAAPQVGSNLRICLVTLDTNAVTALLNPEIIQRSARKTTDEEGCLSLPGIWLSIPRASKITVRYMDEKGKEHEKEFEGFVAREIQHEVDHLNGILIVDYLQQGIPLVAREKSDVLD